MSSELKVNKVWPRSYTTSSIEMNDGEVVIFPRISVDSIVSTTGDIVSIEGWDSSAYVLLTTDQTVNGVKTFTSIPVLPDVDPTLDNHAVRKKYVDDEVYNAVSALTVFPPGACMPYAGSTSPAGFLLCNGASYSVSTYASLFSVIGYTYGGSSGTFQVPNMKGKVVAGYDATQTEFNSLGKTGGEKTHLLTIPEMPAHTHSYTGPLWDAREGGSVSLPMCQASTLTGSTGGSATHNNIQPYITLNYIIKY